MKITVFTSNQPRHRYLISRLSEVCESVHAVLECSTVFPGKIEDFYRNSPVMQRYLGHVISAERETFGDIHFFRQHVKTLSVKMGDLSFLDRESLGEAMSSDAFVVFGSSYIRGWLVDELVKRSAVNIHMGLSPYYRGSSCNFWAMYDGRPAFVGATIHYLSAGLDSGPIIANVRPEFKGQDPFGFTMAAVEAAQSRLASEIEASTLFESPATAQDSSLELRYSRGADFDDSVAEQYLQRIPTPAELGEWLMTSEQPALLS